MVIKLGDNQITKITNNNYTCGKCICTYKLVCYSVTHQPNATFLVFKKEQFNLEKYRACCYSD